MPENDKHDGRKSDGESGEGFDFTRRQALASAGVASSAVVLPFSELPLDEADPGEVPVAPAVEEVEEDAFQYFEFDQALLVEALAERIYPSDDLGPGAPEAGVVFFVDHQLAGAWGEGAKHYMEGPFHPEEAVPGQGWQYRLTPNEVYDHALDAVEEHAQAEYGASFVDLDAEDQDAVIGALADDEVDTFRGIDPSDFFAMLRSNVLEGMFSDPMYGGNRNMVGWELKQFPGAPASFLSYRDEIESEEFIDISPRSLEQIVEEESPGELELDENIAPHVDEETTTGDETATGDDSDDGSGGEADTGDGDGDTATTTGTDADAGGETDG